MLDWRHATTVVASAGLLCAVCFSCAITNRGPLLTSVRHGDAARSQSEMPDDHDQIDARGRQSCMDVIQRWRQLLKCRWYTWALATMSGLMCVTNLSMLITTYISDTFGKNVTGAAAESVASVPKVTLAPWVQPLMGAAFPAGLLACMVLPGHFYIKLDETSQRAMCIRLQCVSLFGALFLAVFSGSGYFEGDVFDVSICVFLIFLTAFGLGIAYYIPMHAASVRLAPRDAGLCNSTIDGIGYIFSLLFTLLSSYVLESSAGWGGVWAMAAGCIAFSIYAMGKFFDAVLLADATIEAASARSSETRYSSGGEHIDGEIERAAAAGDQAARINAESDAEQIEMVALNVP